MCETSKASSHLTLNSTLNYNVKEWGNKCGTWVISQPLSNVFPIHQILTFNCFISILFFTLHYSSIVCVSNMFMHLLLILFVYWTQFSNKNESPPLPARRKSKVSSYFDSLKKKIKLLVSIKFQFKVNHME